MEIGIMKIYDKTCQRCGENTVNTETGTCDICKHTKDLLYAVAQKYKFYLRFNYNNL